MGKTTTQMMNDQKDCMAVAASFREKRIADVNSERVR